MVFKWLYSSVLFFLFVYQTHASSSIPSYCRIVVVGAGPGGIYSAYRLAVESKVVPANKICIFEALNRPGGRIFTVKGAVPTFEDFTVDLGAYRYGRSRHTMMRSIIEDVEKYDWQCYTDLLDETPDTCASVNTRIFLTRGRVFGINKDGTDATTTFTNYSSKIPYVIPPRGRWGESEEQTSPRDPFSFILGPNSALSEIADRWEEFDGEQDYKKGMKIADEILAKVTNGGNYKGIPYHEVSVWQVARDQGYDMEELKLYIDQSGPATPYLLHTHIERLATLSLRQAALAKKDIGFPGLVVPVVRRNGRRRRVGLNVLFKGLLKKAEDAGVKVFYNQRVGRITRASKKSKRLVVTLASGKTIRTSNVIINSAMKDIESFGLMSEPVASADEKTRQALSRIVPMPGTKAYCFWDDAWWVTKLNATSGLYRLADSTLYQGRYHDGDVVCSEDGKCRGALLVSYASGSVHSGVPVSHIRSFNTHPYVPLVKTDAMIRLVQGEMSEHQKLLYQEIHKQLRNAHRSTFAKMGYDPKKMFEVIPNARGCLISDWRDYGHQVDIGAGRGGNDNRRFSRPVQSLNIALVNECWSEFRGWSEGTLIAAERALYHQYGLQRPKWLDETFHHSVIKLYNRGRLD